MMNFQTDIVLIIDKINHRSKSSIILYDLLFHTQFIQDCSRAYHFYKDLLISLIHINSTSHTHFKINSLKATDYKGRKHIYWNIISSD